MGIPWALFWNFRLRASVQSLEPAWKCCITTNWRTDWEGGKRLTCVGGSPQLCLNAGLSWGDGLCGHLTHILGGRQHLAEVWTAIKLLRNGASRTMWCLIHSMTGLLMHHSQLIIRNDQYALQRPPNEMSLESLWLCARLCVCAHKSVLQQCDIPPHLSVHLLGMLKDGDDITDDCDAQVHHDLLAQVHQHVLVDPAWQTDRRMKCFRNQIRTGAHCLWFTLQPQQPHRWSEQPPVWKHCPKALGMPSHNNLQLRWTPRIYCAFAWTGMEKYSFISQCRLCWQQSRIVSEHLDRCLEFFFTMVRILQSSMVEVFRGLPGPSWLRSCPVLSFSVSQWLPWVPLAQLYSSRWQTAITNCKGNQKPGIKAGQWKPSDACAQDATQENKCLLRNTSEAICP